MKFLAAPRRGLHFHDAGSNCHMVDSITYKEVTVKDIRQRQLLPCVCIVRLLSSEAQSYIATLGIDREGLDVEREFILGRLT